MKLAVRLNSWFAILQNLIFKKRAFAKESTTHLVVDEVFDEVDEMQNLEENRFILDELAFVKNQLDYARVVFNLQTNFDLIESSIYYIDSLETKYNYLIKEARKRRLKGVFQ